jgi:RND family efflux transporter MFP subunit
MTFINETEGFANKRESQGDFVPQSRVAIHELRRGNQPGRTSAWKGLWSRRSAATGEGRNPFGIAVVLALLFAGASTPLRASDPAVVAGITEPILDVTLSASVPGIITTRKFKEGDSVKEGETIIELDKRLEELEVERRRLVVEARRIDYEGTAKLFKTTKGTSKEELDKKESDYKLAVVEHSMAVEQLRRRVLTAPLSGTLVDLPLQAGESCQPYQHLARMVDTRRCYFVANVEATAASPLELNQKVQLELETGAGARPVTGTVVFLSPVADPASGLIRIKILFENAGEKIRPGLAGRMLLK